MNQSHRMRKRQQANKKKTFASENEQQQPIKNGSNNQSLKTGGVQ